MSDFLPCIPPLRLSALEKNTPQRVKTANGQAVLVRADDDTLTAFITICPHAMGDMAYAMVYGGAIECPLHGWRFDQRDGTCLDPVNESPLRTFPTRLIDGTIEVQISRPKWMDD